MLLQSLKYLKMVLVSILFQGKPDHNGGMTLDADMFSFLSRKVGKSWRRFARNLEVDDDIIDEIDANDNNVSLEDKCMAVINKFDYEVELKWNQIKDVLIEIELVNVAVAFEETYFKVERIF